MAICALQYRLKEPYYAGIRDVQGSRGQRRQGHDGCWETLSGSPLVRCEHEERADTSAAGLSDKWLVREGGSAWEAQTCRTIGRSCRYARTTSLACWSGDGICECDIIATVALQTERFLRATSCYFYFHFVSSRSTSNSAEVSRAYRRHPCGTTKFSLLNAVCAASGAEMMWMKRDLLLTDGRLPGERRSTGPPKNKRASHAMTRPPAAMFKIASPLRFKLQTTSTHS